MITYEDCLALADLTPEAVDRVAAREGLTAIAALGLASRQVAATEGRQSGGQASNAVVPEAVARPATIHARVTPVRLRTEQLAA